MGQSHVAMIALHLLGSSELTVYLPDLCVSGSVFAGFGTDSRLNRHRNRARGAKGRSTGGYSDFGWPGRTFFRPAEPDIFHDVVPGAKPVPLLSALG